jgi:hypothetical protein
MKTSEIKKFVEIFCEAFLIFKKYFASAIQALFNFYKKGFLNSEAARIRVKRINLRRYVQSRGSRLWQFKFAS